jgi:hypothetical protein
MGFYIEGPAKGKADFIVKNYEAERVTGFVNLAKILSEGKQALICVVDNGPFEAAAFAYSIDEFECFNDRKDTRPKEWLLMDHKKACELTGYRDGGHANG